MPGGQDHRYRPLRGRVIPDEDFPVPKPQPRPLPAHCWVEECPELPGRRPGLLLEWRKGPKGWAGHVVVGADGTEGMLVLVMWVAAEHLRPGV